MTRIRMNRVRTNGVRQLLAALAVCLCLPHQAAAQAVPANADAALFRLYLTDGTSLLSYGEPTRVGDLVVFSIPVGGSPHDPRLHPVTLSASLVDWPRSDQYALSARYQRFAGRAEDEYQRLTDHVAAVLNQVALSTDRTQALALAIEARRTLADWPRQNFGYRQDDLRDVVALLDGSIARLKGTVPNAFDLSLVASPSSSVPLEPLATMPGAREQLDQILRLLALTPAARDRVVLMQSALALLNESRSGIDPKHAAGIRKSLESQLRDEAEVDRRYAKMTQELMTRATRAAAEAKISDVQRVLNRIPGEDEELGRRRPDVVQALTSSVQAQVERARHLRLLRDQWSVRQRMFSEYQRTIGSDMLLLVKAQPSLEAIRTFEGPDPGRLASLRNSLTGGSERLQRLYVPDYLRQAHDLLVTAWRFAETATRARQDAVVSGNVTTAWEASSAAAGALMMLSRAQQELRTLVEPPRLQ